MNGYHHLWTMKIIPVSGNEIELNHGRFEYFTQEHQEHAITLKMPRMSGEELTYRFNERLLWVAEQSQTPWSFFMYPKSIDKVDMEFSFANVTTAVVFKLVWG